MDFLDRHHIRPERGLFPCQTSFHPEAYRYYIAEKWKAAARERLPGYEFEGWVGLALPAATPDDTAKALHDALMRVLKSAEARQWFAELGAEAGAESPE